MADAAIPSIVFTLWRVTLVVAYLVLLPVAVYWLHSLWRTANSIRHYASDAADAAEAIERNTAAIPALDATISVASEMLTAAESIAARLDAAASTLESRVARG